jgi:hypothetical protein
MCVKEEFRRDGLVATVMDGTRHGFQCNPPPRVSESPLKIDFLDEEEVSGVESSHRLPCLTPDQEGSACSPVNIGAMGVVNPSEVGEPVPNARNVVEEYCTTQHARQRREAIRRRLQRPVIINEARCNCPHRSIIVEYGAEIPEGSRAKMRVGVNCEYISSRKELNPMIDRSPVAEIRERVLDPNSRPSYAHMARRAVGRPVIHDGDGDLYAVLRQQARDACIEPLLAVIAWDDRRDESARARFDDPF